jgi:Peptide-N-glycosidase F, C terminal
MIHTRCVAVPVLILMGALASPGLSQKLLDDFDKQHDKTKLTLENFDGKPEPKIEKGKLILMQALQAKGNLNNSAAWDRVAEGIHRQVEMKLRFSTSPGAQGMGFALLPTAKHGIIGKAPRVDAWEAPKMPGTFAFSVDVYNPPTSHWFDAFGNYYGRPEREVALFWDRKEIARFLVPVEIRDRKMHDLTVKVRYDAGGAFVSVQVDDALLAENRFFAGLISYESRPAVGARSGLLYSDFILDKVEVEWTEPSKALEISPKAQTIQVFDGPLLWASNRDSQQVVYLPEYEPGEVRRIVMSLRLEPGPGGWDEWDRGAAVYIWRGEDKKSERIELFRYMTPYKRKYTWFADVTDYAPLLRGGHLMGLHIGTWKGKSEPQKGFKVYVDLHYYEGKPDRIPVSVHQLWAKIYKFNEKKKKKGEAGKSFNGNTEEAIAKGFPEVKTKIPEGIKSAKIRITTTGHQQDGEFVANVRRLTVAGSKVFENNLWTTDCYLNNCRPQSGTWKFDRAGWAPGSYITPWEIELGKWVKPGQPLTLLYRPSVFEKKVVAAEHWVDAVLILYR